MMAAVDTSMSREPGINVLLEFDRLSKTYSSDRGVVEALREVSFSVERHEFLSIIGRSGCGKSTLLKVAAGVSPPTAGRVVLDGSPVTGPVKGLGMVFQTPLLLEWRDVLGNVALPLEILNRDGRESRERARELVNMVGLSGFEHSRPNELSGGMQQRVAICRALSTDPPLLLMDEPFGALDALTRDEMGAELLRIQSTAHKTIVFVTHSIEEAVLLSDRVVVLSERPGQVRTIVKINLPRPRNQESRADPQFAECGLVLRDAVFNKAEPMESAG